MESAYSNHNQRIFLKDDEECLTRTTSLPRFVKSGEFPFVYASDLSVNMLVKANELLQADPEVNPAKIMLVLADVVRLPFASASIAGEGLGQILNSIANFVHSEISDAGARVYRVVPADFFRNLKLRVCGGI